MMAIFGVGHGFVGGFVVSRKRERGSDDDAWKIRIEVPWSAVPLANRNIRWG
jgi:hypothetical protein